MTNEVSLLVLPRISFEGDCRRQMMVSPGTSIAEMIETGLSDLPFGIRSRAQVRINGHLILPGLWRAVRPKPGSSVVIRCLPAGANLRGILGFVVTVAAFALGQFYAAPLALSLGTSTAFANSLITAGVTIAGNLLLNALVPIKPPESKKEKPRYSIQGWRNGFNPDGVVPAVLGKIRVAPPFAASPYTESVGKERYLTAIFNFGYGPVNLTNLRIGETPLSDYKGVRKQIRYGYPGADPITLYPRQVIEEAVSTTLTFDAEEPPEVIEGDEELRYTASDASGFSIDLGFPRGLIRFKSEGDEENRSVQFRIRYRLNGTGAWTNVTAGAGEDDISLSIEDKTSTPFVRTLKYEFASRGRYQIGVTRMKREDRNSRKISDCDWTAIRSYRPEYPLNFPKPLALVCLRIRATKQLNGVLDNFNADVSRICLDWDADDEIWIERETQNPASLFRFVLQGPAITYPLSDEEIDAVEDWHEYCTLKGLKYNRNHDYEASIYEVLADVCAAGRASPHDKGTKWGVIIDRIRDQVTAHISARNSWAFEGNRSYIKFPDAFRVPFPDQTNNYENAQRIVPRPGFVGTPVITEELEFPGLTDPAQVWTAARRRWRELLYRPDRWFVQQDIESLVHVRGDMGVLNHDMLDRIQVSARVKSVNGNIVELDDIVTMEAGQTYVVRFRHVLTDEVVDGNPDEVSIVRTIETIAGESTTVFLTGNGLLPSVGDLALFGKATSESIEVIVQNIERAEDFSARLTLIAHAPQIDTETDADTPPAWDGRVGEEIGTGNAIPDVPVIQSIVSGVSAQTDEGIDRVLVTIIPGDTQSDDDYVAPKTYQVQHRIDGAGSWAATVSGGANEGPVAILGYANGDEFEAQARALGPGGDASGWTVSKFHTVAGDDPVIPPPELGTEIYTTDGITAVWTNPNYEMLRGGKVWRAASGAGFPAAVNVVPNPGFIFGGPNRDLSYTETPESGDYDYWVTVEDLDGVTSLPAGPITVQIFDVLGAGGADYLGAGGTDVIGAG